MRSSGEIVTRGALAGFLGGTVLVLWFLALDLLQGRPLYTPRFLAQVLMGIPFDEVGVVAIFTYTVVHYAAFLLIGIIVATGLQRLRAIPGFLLGVILGFLMFDVLFYASVLVTGEDVVLALGWPQVLAGNLLAGVTILGYLHLTRTVPGVDWWAVLRAQRIVREGVVAGVIGAVTVAVWFLVIDLLAGRALFTPAALGSAFFLGARGVAEVEITFAVIAGYTALHVAAFAIAGLVVAALVVQAEREPRIFLGLVLLFVTFQAMFVGLLTIAAAWILDTLGWGSVAIGNLLATIAMGAYLWQKHPALVDALRQPSLEEPT